MQMLIAGKNPKINRINFDAKYAAILGAWYKLTQSYQSFCEAGLTLSWINVL